MGTDEPIGKPFPAAMPFDDFDGCVAAVGDNDDIDDPEAFCAWLEDQGEDALSDPEAAEILTDLSVEFVSVVDDPAQDSEWVIAKHAEGPDGDTHRWASEVPILLKRADGVDGDGDGSEEKQIAYAPVLIPGEADKQGDVIPDHEIESAAHEYLAKYRKVDADHDLVDGAGVPVESWVAKTTTTFDRPDGSTSREYPDGTWFLGVKFDDDAWGRVKSGDLSGFSIYGGAKPIDVDAVRSTTETTTTKTDMNATISKADSADVAGSKAVVDEFVEANDVDKSEATVKDVLEWARDEFGDGDESTDDTEDDDVIDALKAVADAVDQLDDRVADLEDGDEYGNDRMGDDGGNDRTQSVKALIGRDDGGEPNRKAVAGQRDGDDGDDLRVSYDGIADGEDADATASESSGGSTASANRRMVTNGGD